MLTTGIHRQDTERKKERKQGRRTDMLSSLSSIGDCANPCLLWLDGHDLKYTPAAASLPPSSNPVALYSSLVVVWPSKEP